MDDNWGGDEDEIDIDLQEDIKETVNKPDGEQMFPEEEADTGIFVPPS